MDTLAEELLSGALAAPTLRPRVLASVLTRWRVLDLLDDAQCGELMGRYYEQLAASARLLRAGFDARQSGRLTDLPPRPRVDHGSPCSSARRAVGLRPRAVPVQQFLRQRTKRCS
ncbi:hypothetical protein O7600_28570 [Micromonospora sp. WMMA1998]|uniref:hypothetical protein n=1 Tax=Micromonospora sp. WMMA1998 TaxID=3015167 RepID=UPI00248AA69B|nr:hypothetical protein [Micromonospora sp. WMMA1998]WBC14969.1 hypothetical protein O7600_28570 [Micromonospora sp. WMMA1998]